jgi:hypothetical protein
MPNSCALNIAHRSGSGSLNRSPVVFPEGCAAFQKANIVLRGAAQSVFRRGESCPSARCTVLAPVLQRREGCPEVAGGAVFRAAGFLFLFPILVKKGQFIVIGL